MLSQCFVRHNRLLYGWSREHSLTSWRKVSLYTADLPFDWLGFSCFAYVELDTDLQVWSNPNQSNRRWYFSLQSKCALKYVIPISGTKGKCTPNSASIDDFMTFFHPKLCTYSLTHIQQHYKRAMKWEGAERNNTIHSG